MGLWTVHRCEAGGSIWLAVRSRCVGLVLAKKPLRALAGRFLRGVGRADFTYKILFGSISTGAKSVAGLVRRREFASPRPGADHCRHTCESGRVFLCPVRSRCSRLEKGADALHTVVWRNFRGLGRADFTYKILFGSVFYGAKSVCFGRRSVRKRLFKPPETG